MAQEIERKFLVKNHDWHEKFLKKTEIAQGYLSSNPTVRVRVEGSQGFITIKGKTTLSGMTRNEWEYDIPLEDAAEMLILCTGIVYKTRYIIPNGDHKIELDFFRGDNAGLVVAEIELLSEEDEFNKPSWLGEEVTGQIKYYNSELSINPYKNW